MKNNDSLRHKTRKRIFNYIEKNPGLHIRELSRKMNIPMSTLDYHLRNLEKNGFIEINTRSRFGRIYATKNIGVMSKNLITALRQKTSRNIILYLYLQLNASQIELSKELDLSITTIAKHTKRLEKLGIIEPIPIENGKLHTAHKNKIIINRSPYGREVIYRLTRPSNTNIHTSTLLFNLLSRYKAGLVDETIEFALEYLDIVNPDRVLPKRFNKLILL